MEFKPSNESSNERQNSEGVSGMYERGSEAKPAYIHLLSGVPNYFLATCILLPLTMRGCGFGSLEKKLDEVAKAVESRPGIAYVERNVLGGSESEKFYVLPDGTRAFVAIDGKSIDKCQEPGSQKQNISSQYIGQ